MSALEALKAAFLAHAEAEYPREACGLVALIEGEAVYCRCANSAAESNRFRIPPAEYAAVEDRGAILAVVHSHPDGVARPSLADRFGCDRSGLPWVIVSWPQGAMTVIEPQHEVRPLLGREFAHGVVDCYTAIQDFYALHGIVLPAADRPDDWWLQGGDLYEDNVRAAGFIPLAEGEPLQPGDVLFMGIRSPVSNHGAVYLGDNIIFHHLIDRLSEKTVYGEFFRKCTRSKWRHREWQPLNYMAI